jgi:hypothetical protein
MSALPTRCVLLVLVAMGTCLHATSALAQRVPAKELREARDRLRDYEPDTALDVLASLSRFLAAPGDRRATQDRHEGRFLRAVTAADLLLLSGRPGFGLLDGRVAAALGVPAEALREHLEQELGALEFGRFRPIVEDARAALASRADDADESGRGPRLDLQRLTRVAAALKAEDPVEALARIARDPCEPGPCEDSAYALSARSRRALSAFQTGLQAAARLDLAADYGDPFSRAAEHEVEALGAELVRARLHLRPRPEAGLGGLEGRRDADVFVTITARGFVVQSAVDYGLRGGVVRVVSPDGCGRRVEIPFSSAIGKRIAAVTELARALPRGCGESVAVAGEDEVEAHLVLRVLESVRSAGLKFAGLAGVDAGGELVVRSMELVDARDDAVVDVLGTVLVVGRGARRDQLPLASLVVPATEDLGRLARALDRAPRALRVARDVPFLALRVILRALEDRAALGSEI